MINTLLLSALALFQTGAPVHSPSPQIVIKDNLVGKGPTVKVGDIVWVDYVATLSDGTEFNNSSGKPPFMFMVGSGQVIDGWDQGIVGMHEGGKRVLTIPPALAYGDKQVGSIPANSTLKFAITLEKIEPKVEIEILTKGTGAEAKVGDTAYVQFVGGVKGKHPVFDTQDPEMTPKGPVPIEIGEPRFPIGFVPTLVGMREGEKRRVVIPSDLAYGKTGIPKTDTPKMKAGSIVPPDSVMEFTFELVKIQRKDATQ